MPSIQTFLQAGCQEAGYEEQSLHIPDTPTQYVWLNVDPDPKAFLHPKSTDSSEQLLMSTMSSGACQSFFIFLRSCLRSRFLFASVVGDVVTLRFTEKQ